MKSKFATLLGFCSRVYAKHKIIEMAASVLSIWSLHMIDRGLPNWLSSKPVILITLSYEIPDKDMPPIDVKITCGQETKFASLTKNSFNVPADVPIKIEVQDRNSGLIHQVAWPKVSAMDYSIDKTFDSHNDHAAIVLKVSKYIYAVKHSQFQTKDVPKGVGFYP